MGKYYLIFKNTLQEFLVYRLSFVLWRFRSFISFLAILFFWMAIYRDNNRFLGYQKSQMYIYVLGIAFLKGMVFSTRTSDLAGMIREGELSRLLLMPISVFKVFLSRDIADKLLNFSFALFEIFLAIKIFNLPLFFPDKISSAVAGLLLIPVGFLLYFFLSMVLSLTAFWTDDIWAMRWIFMAVFLEFFSGALFPIDVLPFWLQKIIYLTPFPYLIYFPLKIWLGQISSSGEITKIFLICFGWLGFFFWLAKSMWRKGYREYGAYGG